MPFTLKKGLKETISKWKDRNQHNLETELDEIEINYYHHKPASLKSLLQSTQFSRRELQIIYRGFKEDCPTGYLTEDIFKFIIAKYFPQGDANMYAHFVYRTFDHSSVGKITFEQLVRVLSTLIHGPTSTKLMWIFHLYDVDGDGVIDKMEMIKVVQSIYDLLGKHTDPPYDEASVQDHTDVVFQKLDLNHDGVISPAEFLQACSDDPNIADAIDCLHTII